MKYFSSTLLVILLFIIPIPHNLIASPLFKIASPVQKKLQIPDIQNLSYDEVVTFLHLIESNSLSETDSTDLLDQANLLLSFLALEGATEKEKGDLNKSIATLFTKDPFHYASLIDSDPHHAFEPAVFRGELYRNNLKNPFLASSGLFQNSHSHLGPCFQQWPLIPNTNSEDPPCQNSNSSGCFGMQDVILCKNKSWFKKQWKQTKKFIKKHKKEIIIGAIVVVSVTVVVVTAVAISSTAASAAATAGTLGSASYQKDPVEQTKPKPASLGDSLQEQISTFKETVAQEQFSATSSFPEISMEENGRIIGSMFTHKTIDTLTHQATFNPLLHQELEQLAFHPQIPLPKWADIPMTAPHSSVDLAFSTPYSPMCFDHTSDLNTLTYQARGNWALSSGYYPQAIQDFGKAIEIEPNDPSSYLGRGLAHFELGSYEQSIADYNNYVSQVKQSFSITDFSVGFAKGLPKGIYDSGEGLLLFVTDLTCHPIQTAKQVYESISILSALTKSGEWNLIAETLSPKLHQLISEWDTLPAREKGELSGYAFGKHGADLLLPTGAAKAIAKGSTAAKELGVICKNLQSAEKLLVLEAIAEGSSSGINVVEVITSANKTFVAGEELGLTTKEIATLKQSGELERVIGKGRDFFTGNPEMQASYDLFKSAQQMLKPYIKQAMPEAEIRNLIHQTGLTTFQKPLGIPENYLVRITEKCAGMEYFDPIQYKTSVRVMPGTPHSSNLRQQKPYVIHTKRGKTLNKFGKEVSSDSPEAHIPLSEFVYKD